MSGTADPLNKLAHYVEQFDAGVPLRDFSARRLMSDIQDAINYGNRTIDAAHALRVKLRAEIAKLYAAPPVAPSDEAIDRALDAFFEPSAESFTSRPRLRAAMRRAIDAAVRGDGK